MKFALKFISRFKILLIVLIVFVALDLVSKWYVFEKILGITSDDIHLAVEKANKAVEDDESGKTPFQPNKSLNIHRVELIKDHVYFTSVLNPGAFSGFLGGNRPLLLSLSIIAVIVLLIIFFKATKITFVTQFLGGIIFAGALGNFYDRVVFRVVRDFVDCRIPELPEIKFFNPWNTFNLADAFITVGVATFMLILLLTKSEKPKSETKDKPPVLSEPVVQNAKHIVVFPDKVDISAPEFADELAKITNLHPIDARRLCRKQEGFIEKPFTLEIAEKIREFFENTIHGVKIIHIDKFPKVARFKDVTNIEGLEDGLLIDRQKSRDLKPIPWDTISHITLAIIAGKSDPLTKHINETLDNSKIFTSRDLTRDEKSKVLGSLLQDYDKIALWNKFLEEQMQEMNAEVLKDNSEKMPTAIVSIFCENDENYRVSSKSMIPVNLAEGRTPNNLVNFQIMVNQVVQSATPGIIDETVLAYVQQTDTPDGKTEFKAQIVENMAFASLADYDNYLRWYTNIKNSSLKNFSSVRDSMIELIEIDTKFPDESADNAPMNETENADDTEEKPQE